MSLKKKIMKNQLIESFTKDILTELEKSKLVYNYQKHTKLSNSAIARELNISRPTVEREIYFYELCKTNPEIIDKALRIGMPYDRLKRMNYIIKDKKKLVLFIKKYGKEPITKAETIISELRNKYKIYTHFERTLYNLRNDLDDFKLKISNVPTKFYTTAINKINETIIKLEEIREMFNNN